MTERSTLIQQAFQDEPLGPADRERLWNTMPHRARQARGRNLIIAALLVLAAAIVAGALIVRNAIRSTSSTGPDVFSPVIAAADSIPTELPVEVSVSQETRAEVPSDLIPLLGHRSGLAIDLANQTARRDVLTERLNRTGPGAEHQRLSLELESVERQIHSTQVAIEVIDRRLAGHDEQVAVAAPGEATTIHVDPPQVIQVGGNVPDEILYAAGGAGLALALGMVAILFYMKRLARSTRDMLSQIENQVSSQHATLASGIDAIAVEVERLGEGQRFMSKALAEGKAAVR